LPETGVHGVVIRDSRGNERSFEYSTHYHRRAMFYRPA
jgi:hypothetical protein